MSLTFMQNGREKISMAHKTRTNSNKRDLRKTCKDGIQNKEKGIGRNEAKMKADQENYSFNVC